MPSTNNGSEPKDTNTNSSPLSRRRFLQGAADITVGAAALVRGAGLPGIATGICLALPCADQSADLSLVGLPKRNWERVYDDQV